MTDGPDRAPVADPPAASLPAGPSARERARGRAITRGSLAGLALVVVASLLTLPLLVLSPGPTYNVLGEVSGTPVITISGTPTYPTDGALDMTTVLERGGTAGGIRLLEALVGWVSPQETVLPREAFYGPDTTGEEIAEQNDQLFALSQSDAIGAAMGELGIETTTSVVVTLVGGGTPADGIVQAGDEIVGVDGRPVAQPADVTAAVRAREVGDTVVLDVRRPGDPEPTRERLEVVTGANPDAGSQPDGAPVPYLGIAVGTAHEAPFSIDFSVEDVGGPSAGLVFSLALVDLLTEESMTGGGHVAGTGSITPDGVVGAIGGIEQKLMGAREAGATLFLVPQANCAEVVGNEPEGLAVVPVATLAEARDVVEAWAADPDARFPRCQRGLRASG